MLWLLGAVCAFFTGIAKTGVPGLGILVVPLMVLAVGDARLSAGWLLPMLCTADLFAVFYFRRHPAANRLFVMAPWVLAGMVAGALALFASERTLRPVVGGIVLVMLAIYVWRRRGGGTGRPDHPAPYGVAAGFSTTVANAAGPVMNLYLLGQRLPKEDFVATGAWFFFIVNLLKLPVYAYHGMLSRQSLLFDLYMVPAVMAGAITGRWLLDRIPARPFELLVIVLTVVSTALLFF